MGEDRSEKLEFIPAQVKVIEHIRPKYTCRHCKKHETTVQIQQARLPEIPIEKGIATANNGQPNIVLFDYQASHSASYVVNYLARFTGFLQVDGYQAYEKTNTQLVECWAQTRRKFMDAKKLQGKHKTGKTDIALTLIRKLYAIEAEIKEKSPLDKLMERQHRSQPLLATFRQ